MWLQGSADVIGPFTSEQEAYQYQQDRNLWAYQIVPTSRMEDPRSGNTAD